ncbi:unnamed protein product [Schistosoma intercalatum]|nr:unnamed protein product [Schistosoma intercalatum]
MVYGMLQCLDHLLVIYTFLPLRCFLTVLNLMLRISSGIFQFFTYFNQYHDAPPSKTSRLTLLYNYELRDLIKFSLLCICTNTIVIKIYIFFNLLEVADRLLSAVCQDALDDLLFTISKPRSDSVLSNDLEENSFIFWRDIVLQYCFAFFCLIAHCFLLLCQVTTLNVAFNSQNKSLITVFISNNFVELKGNVFRKMGKTNLFQIACADVRERFHYCVWFSIIVCRNMNESGWNLDDLQTILIDVTYILLAEVAVDWIKHSFITKFNVIPSNVYEEYTVSIAYDLLLCHQGKNTSDYSDLLSRRMGLTPIPLKIPALFALLYRLLCLYYLQLKLQLTLPLCPWLILMYDENCSFDNDKTGGVFTTTVKGNIKQSQHILSEKEIPISSRKPPFGFTGYDQPTKDEDCFLPTGLRYRKFKSDSGPVDITINMDINHSLTPEDTSELAGNKLRVLSPISTGSIWNELIEPYQSIMASATGTPKSLYELNESAPLTPLSRIGSANRIFNPGNNKSEIECERGFHGSCVFQTEDKPQFTAYTNTPIATLHNEGLHVRNRYEMTSILELYSNKDESFTTMVRPPSACVLLRPRYYSIDLGILSTFLTSMERNARATDETPIKDGSAQENESKPTYTFNPIHKRRVRTMTESSGTAPSHPPRDPTIPILWERSSRNSTANQFGLDRLKPITPGRVKQPLSDIDRYSMVEGQIS